MISSFFSEIIRGKKIFRSFGKFLIYKNSFLKNSNTDSDNDISDPIAITNVLTGLQQPTISKDDKSIIFAGYSGVGWDLYGLNNPLNLSSKKKQLK